jgi:amino acid transporter
MQLILKAQDVSETQGFFDAMVHALGQSTAAKVFIDVLGVGSLYCYFDCLIPWTTGANLAARESANAGDLPQFFARRHPVRNTPTGAALLCSIIGTVFTLVYAILFQATDGGIDDVFWSLFAFSSLIFLLPYIAMMLAFRQLRRVDPNAHRPYRVPGSDGFVTAVTWVPVVLLALAALFFAGNPWDFDGTLTGGIAVGLVITVIIQEIFVCKAPSWRRARALERSADPDACALLQET